MGGEAHFFYTMMYFMKLPQHWKFMQTNMGEPLNKIQQNKKDNELRPLWPRRRINNGQAFGSNAEVQKKYFEQLIKTTNNNGENEEIEEHIKCIQPKVLSKNGLLFSPWKKDF